MLNSVLLVFATAKATIAIIPTMRNVGSINPIAVNEPNNASDATNQTNVGILVSCPL